MGCAETINIPWFPAPETVSTPVGATLSVDATCISDPELGVGASLRWGFGQAFTFGFGADATFVVFDDDCAGGTKLAFCGGAGMKLAYRWSLLSIGMSFRVGVSLGDYATWLPGYVSPYLLVGFGDLQQLILSMALSPIVSAITNPGVLIAAVEAGDYIPCMSVSLLVGRVQLGLLLGPRLDRYDERPYSFGAQLSYKIPLRCKPRTAL
jgi:hypothetical protein